jgi:hypothetical protein
VNWIAVLNIDGVGANNDDDDGDGDNGDSNGDGGDDCDNDSGGDGDVDIDGDGDDDCGAMFTRTLQQLSSSLPSFPIVSTSTLFILLENTTNQNLDICKYQRVNMTVYTL